MCLLVFSYKNHPDYDLIFAANRDEFYGRPTRPAVFWEDHPNLLAGKDLKAGGTWMGITKSGKISALTNYRDPSIQKDDAPSRGHLVRNYLTDSTEADTFLKDIKRNADRYNGFNILAGTIERLMYYSNQEKEIRPLDPGLYGLSNKLLDTPWPKVQHAKAELNAIVSQDSISEEALFDLLKYDHQAPDEELPDTGIPIELERAVSPVFIATDKYGTHSSTILLIGKSGEVVFEERRFVSGTQQVDDVNRYEFKIK